MTVEPYALHRNHLLELQASGLTDETIKAAGIFSEHNRDKIAVMLNRKSWPKECGAVLVFPFKDRNGDTILRRVKPDSPQKRGGKRGPKYISPSGAVVRPYFPAGVIDSLDESDSKCEVMITEGEKKSLCGTQYGVPTIGLCGVDCWHKKRSVSLLPDLAAIDWQGRETYICFDSDAATNENVENNERLLADALVKQGAAVRIVRLPAGDDGEKVGLDDFLVKHNLGPLRKLMNEAEDPEPVDPGSVMLPATQADPAEEAGRFIDGTRWKGIPRIRFWNEQFWYWRQGKFQTIPESEMKSKVIRHLNKNYRGVGRSVVLNLMDQINAAVIISGRVETPAWLDGGVDRRWPADELLVTRNKIIHLPSLMAGTQFDIEITPALFSTSALDLEFVGNDCPPPTKWLDFLNALWPDDPEAIEALQKWFGYCLTSDTRQHKLMMLVGPMRSGKGTIARIQRALTGEDNTAAPTLSTFAQQFGLAGLIGKSLAIVGDARLSGRNDNALIVERILSITGEDALDIDRKFLPTLTSHKLSSRLMLLSNELPRLSDASGALASRMIVLQLTRSWYGSENMYLTDELLGELSGILWWAIDGWRMLRESGRFLQPESGAELVSEMRELASPISMFVAERCLIGPEYSVSKKDLFESYRQWSESAGRRFSEDQAGFGRSLRAVLPSLRTSQPRIAGKQTRHYVGIGLPMIQL